MEHIPMDGSMVSNENIEILKKRIDELESLLKVDQVLSSILEPMEIYSAMAELVQEKLEIRHLTIFEYQQHTEQFGLVYSNDLDESTFAFKANDGRLWQQILKNEPFPVNGDTDAPLYSEFHENEMLRKLNSDFWIPLITRDRIMGLLTVGEKVDGQPYDYVDLGYIKHIADFSSICLETCNINAQRQTEKKELDKILQNLSLLYNIGKAMTYISDLKNLLKYILGQAIEVTKAEKGSIMLYDPAIGQLSVSIIEGLEDEEYQEKINNKQIACKSFKPGEGVAGSVFQKAEPIILNETKGDDQFVEAESSFAHSIACIPMVVYNEVIGVINVTNKRKGVHFTEVDVEMLKAISDQAAVAISKAQFREMAVTDFLTGLYIRRYFMVKLQDELIRAERYNKVLSVAMADIDRFKSINDKYGHATGDEVLKAASHFLRENLRQADIIARYGGEEFVIFFPETDKKSASILAERLRDGFSKIKLDNLPQLSISIGVASYPDDGNDIQSLIHNADAAMYTAKQEGRNRVVMF
ncbi:MAG: diguanylate cyclase [Desulfobacterales bacterium]|nr:MAG: diguanylate cyclase [Desulfobacterales bacterium]